MWGERGWAGAGAGDHGVASSGDPVSDADGAGNALRRLIAADIRLEGASDHGVSEALYLRDPDDNGVERQPRKAHLASTDFTDAGRMDNWRVSEVRRSLRNPRER